MMCNENPFGLVVNVTLGLRPSNKAVSRSRRGASILYDLQIYMYILLHQVQHTATDSSFLLTE